MRLSEQWKGLAYMTAGAWKRRCAFMEYDDLVAEALLELVEAEQAWSGREGSFRNYAINAIKCRFVDLIKEARSQKRDLYATWSFSDLEQPGLTFEELYTDICSVDDPFLFMIEVTDSFIQFYKTRSKRERYLLYLKEEEYPSEECRQMYADFLGKDPKQVNVARDLAKLRTEFAAFRAKGEINE